MNQPARTYDATALFGLRLAKYVERLLGTR